MGMIEDEAEKLLAERGPEEKPLGKSTSTLGLGRRFAGLNKAAQHLQKKSAGSSAAPASATSQVVSSNQSSAVDPSRESYSRGTAVSPTDDPRSLKDSVEQSRGTFFDKTSSEHLATESRGDSFNVEQTSSNVDVSIDNLSFKTSSILSKDEGSKRLANIEQTVEAASSSSKRLAQKYDSERRANVEQNRKDPVLSDKSEDFKHLANIEQTSSRSSSGQPLLESEKETSSKHLANAEQSPKASDVQRDFLAADATSSKHLAESANSNEPESNVEQISSSIRPQMESDTAANKFDVESFERLANVEQRKDSPQRQAVSNVDVEKDNGVAKVGPDREHLANRKEPDRAPVGTNYTAPFDSLPGNSRKAKGGPSTSSGLVQEDSQLTTQALYEKSTADANFRPTQRAEANVQQTSSKAQAEIQQTPSKQPEDVEHSSSIRLADVYQTSSEHLAKHPANVELDLPIEMLAGHERKFMEFVFDKCKQLASLCTKEIQAKEIAAALGLDSKVSEKARKHVSNVVRRLIDKGYVSRPRSKTGKAGWAVYQISRSTYNKLLELERTSSNRPAERLETPSISLGIKKDINNRGEESGFINLDWDVGQIELTAVATFGITPKHLYDIKKNKWDICREDLQSIIDRLPVYLRLPDQRKTAQTLYPGIFLGFVKQKAKGGECALDFLPNENDRLIQEHLAQAMAWKAERERMQSELESVQFDRWRSALSIDELAEQIPNLRKLGLRPETDLYLATVKDHFKQNVWPGLMQEMGISS